MPCRVTSSSGLNPSGLQFFSLEIAILGCSEPARHGRTDERSSDLSDGISVDFDRIITPDRCSRETERTNGTN